MGFHTGKGMFSTPVRRRRRDRLCRLGRPLVLRARPAGACAGASGPAGSSTRPPCSAAASPGSGRHRDLRLGRRAPLPPAHQTAPPPHARTSGASGHPPAGRRPARQLVGGQRRRSGPAASLFAGNTGGAAYALDPDGHRRWVFTAGNSVWTTPAFGADGSVYCGSLDLLTSTRSTRAGSQLDDASTLGFVDLVAGDRRATGTRLHRLLRRRALRARRRDRRVRWRFQTDDHVYASPALGATAGRTASTSPRPTARSTRSTRRAPALALRHRRRRSAPRPCSARAPHGAGRILYVGSAQRHALRAGRRAPGGGAGPTTRRRATPSLRDRNDLNSSPALGRRGVYIGGEHGRIAYVPYDWCLRHRDPRCDRSPGEAFGPTHPHRVPSRRAAPPGCRGPPGPVAGATTLGARLIVRRGGETVDGAFTTTSPGTLVSTSPPFPFGTQLSGDGHFLYVVPDGFLAPGHQLRRSARRATGPATAPPASVDDAIRFRTAPVAQGRAAAHGPATSVSAFELSRLAVPLPAAPPQPQPDRLRQLRHRGGRRERVEAGPQRRGQAAALGGVHEARPGRRAGGRPPRRPSPSRSRAATATTR